jgi:hypothetical protein
MPRTPLASSETAGGAKQVSYAAMTRDAAKLLDHIAELERKLKAEQAARIASEERAAVGG